MNLGKVLYFVCMILGVWSDTECPNVVSTEDRRQNKTVVRLVQYNIEWMFLDYYEASNCPGDGCTWKNETEVNIHMDHVVKVVQELNPDIINFCEIEGCDELNKMREILGDDTYMPYLKKGKDTATGQNVGMLTRIDPITSLYRTEEKYDYPIKDSKCGYKGNVSSTGVSKHYITEFEMGDFKVGFISAHLLALPTDEARCAEREGQAMVLQKVIYEYVEKGYEVIMLGDLNDYDGEVLDINSNEPRSRVLEILKGKDGDFANEYILYSVGEKISQEERYSDWWDSDNNCKTSSIKDYSVIDHILTTKNIQDRIVQAFMYHGYEEYCGKYDSDHYPVVVDIEF